MPKTHDIDQLGPTEVRDIFASTYPTKEEGRAVFDDFLDRFMAQLLDAADKPRRIDDDD